MKREIGRKDALPTKEVTLVANLYFKLHRK